MSTTIIWMNEVENATEEIQAMLRDLNAKWQVRV